MKKKIQFFQRFKNFRRFHVFFLSYIQWQIKEWDAVFMRLNWSFRWKISKNFHLGKQLFSRKQWTSLGAIVWKKYVFWGLCGIQILKGNYLSYLGKDFESLTNKIQSFQRFKNFQRFRVFVLSYRANSKRQKRRKT